MHVLCLNTLTDLEPFAEAWNRLAGGQPFRRTEWLWSWWRHFGDAGELRVLVVVDDHGDVLGIAPWYIGSRAGIGNVSQFLGNGSVCTDYLGLLIDPGRRVEVISALASHLQETCGRGSLPRGERWDLIHLEATDPKDPGLADLATALEQDGFAVHRAVNFHAWRIDLPACWDDYLKRLSKSQRRQMRRLSRQLDAGNVRVRVSGRDGLLHDGFDHLVDLHQRRRRKLGQPGCFACPKFTGFLREAAERLAASEHLRIAWLEVDGRPLAADLQLRGGGTTFAYQGGVDPDFLDVEPGRMLAVAMLQDDLATGQVGHDLLRGDELYKRHLRAEPVPLIDLRIVPGRMSAQLRHRAWQAGNTLRRWLRGGETTNIPLPEQSS